MQKKSISKNNGVPKFKSEAELADWMQSPAGKRDSERTYPKAKREGKLVKGPANVTPTDPALLQELRERAKAKRTEAVSLRIPVSDIDAAKKSALRRVSVIRPCSKRSSAKACANFTPLTSPIRVRREKVGRENKFAAMVTRFLHGPPDAEVHGLS